MSEHEPDSPVENLQPPLGGEHPRIGSLIGERYRIESFLGQGGTSETYKAEDTLTGQIIALKFLLPKLLFREKEVARFHREVAVASRLDHPAIAKVISSEGIDGPQPYFVMEYVSGQTLAHRIEHEGQLPIDETITVFCQVCEALAFAHARGVLHRDISPSNIMVATSDDGVLKAKLLDFGLAKGYGSDYQSQNLTESKEILGSAPYMSPEQARGVKLDLRSDLYSVGCTLYETLTGSPPHLGQTAMATILKRETDKPIPLTEASLGRTFPPELEHIVARLLQGDPKDRYQSAAELEDDLQRVGKGGWTSAAGQEASTVLPRRKSLRWLAPLLLTSSLLLVIAFMIHGPASVLRDNSATTPADQENRDNSIPANWNTAAVDFDTADALRSKGLYNDAAVYYRRALSLYDQLKVPNNLEQADAIVGLADCCLFQGNYSEAEQHIQRAITAYEQLFGKRKKSIGIAIEEVGHRCLEQKAVEPLRAFRLADPLYARALAIFRETCKPTSIEYGKCYSNEADACAERGLFQQAQERYEKALPILKYALYERKLHVSDVICSLAKTYCETKSYDKLSPLCEQMLSLGWQIDQPDAMRFAGNLVQLADTFAASPDKSATMHQHIVSLYEAARHIYATEPALNREKISIVSEKLDMLHHGKSPITR